MNDSTSTTPQMKRCSKCGEVKPYPMFTKNKNTKDGLFPQCKECRRIYRLANREKAYAKNRTWREDNHKRLIEYNRQWREGNRELHRDLSRKWRVNNRKRSRETSLAWNKANPERRTEIRDRWENNNRWKRRVSNHMRRARLANVGGRGVTEQDIQAMIYCQMGLCAYCERDGQKLTLDHVIPLDQGGPHDPDNTVMCCGVCNSSKGNRTPGQWVNRWYLR